MLRVKRGLGTNPSQRSRLPRIGIAIFCLVILVFWKSSTIFGTGSSALSLTLLDEGEGLYRRIVPERETSYINGLAGTTLWENVYLLKGTLYVVSSRPVEELPKPGWILCAPAENDRKHPPATSREFRYITPEEAPAILGQIAVRKPGLSIFFNDLPGPDGHSSFLAHYFHFEVFLSAWRVVSASYGVSQLPQRVMFKTEPEDWRDGAGLTSWFLQSIMPSTIVEDGPIWADRERTGVTFLFDKLVIVDRFAAHAFGNKVRLWNKMTADLSELPVPNEWMSPLRDGVKAFVKAQGCDLARANPKVPILTYINRQYTKRRLTDEDGERLLDALEDLDRRGIVEFHDAVMERIPRTDQLCLALKTDIMIGVHGNGLSHQLWMKPNSAVLEIMDSGGFAYDYALPADLMGHEYYAIHNDTFLPRSEWVLPDGKAMQQGPNFHSNSLRTWGPYIAELSTKLATARTSPVPARYL